MFTNLITRALLRRCAIFVLLGACGARTRPAAISRPTDIAYQLALVPGTTPAIRVTVETPASAAGTTRFAIDSWGGLDHPDDYVHDVTVRADGRTLAFDRADHAWIVRSAPRAHLAFSYTIQPRDAEHVEQRFLPTATTHFVHLFGNNALVYPEHLDDDQHRRVALRWVGFEQAGWTALSSHGTDPEVVVELPLATFLDAVFLASDRLHVTHKRVRGSDVTIAVVDAPWTFRPVELVDITERLMTSESTFFDEPFPPFFLVALVPFAPEGFAGGSALHQVVTLQANTKQPLRREGGAGSHGRCRTSSSTTGTAERSRLRSRMQTSGSRRGSRTSTRDG